MQHEIGQSILWVVIEVQDTGSILLFPEPGTLHLYSGFVGDIVWYVYTPGWELDPDKGVVFPADTPFDGVPRPDPVRPGCWTTAASNSRQGRFPYHVTVRSQANPSIAVTIDPVVENDPPPSPDEGR